MLFCPKAKISKTVEPVAFKVENNITDINQTKYIEDVKNEVINENLDKLTQNIDTNFSDENASFADANLTEDKNETAQNLEEIKEDPLIQIKSWFAAIFNEFKNDKSFKNVKNINGVEIFANDLGKFKINSVLNELKNSNLLDKMDGFNKSVYIKKIGKILEINIFINPDLKTEFIIDELKNMTNEIKFAKYFVIDGNADIVGNENYNLIFKFKKSYKNSIKITKFFI